MASGHDHGRVRPLRGCAGESSAHADGWGALAHSDKVHCLDADRWAARKRGVPDADIWHGVRNATHKIDMDDDLTMLIGPARDGAPLELGVLGLDSDDPVIIHALPLRAKFYRFLG